MITDLAAGVRLSSASFVDSNIVIYASGTSTKSERARQILRNGPMISVQVLNEVLNVARRKAKANWQTIEARLNYLKQNLPVASLTLRTHSLGAKLARRYGLSTYDAMIVAAALEADCEILWSEDLQDGMVIAAQLTVRNPFVPGVAAPSA